MLFDLELSGNDKCHAYFSPGTDFCCTTAFDELYYLPTVTDICDAYCD